MSEPETIDEWAERFYNQWLKSCEAIIKELNETHPGWKEAHIGNTVIKNPDYPWELKRAAMLHQINKPTN